MTLFYLIFFISKKLFLYLKFESDWLQIPGTVCNVDTYKRMLNKSFSYLGTTAAGLGLSAVGQGLSASLKGLDPYLGTCEFSFLLLQIKDWKLLSSIRDKALPGIL
jgi:hypothetical protein